MADYRESPLYAECTPQEKLWFDNFIETKDIQSATHAAYRMSNDESARSYARTVMGRKHMAELIKQFTVVAAPLPTLDELKQEYVDIARLPSSSSRDKLAALNSYERLCGWGKAKSPANPTDAFDPLDDIND